MYMLYHVYSKTIHICIFLNAKLSVVLDLIVLLYDTQFVCLDITWRASSNVIKSNQVVYNQSTNTPSCTFFENLLETYLASIFQMSNRVSHFLSPLTYRRLFLRIGPRWISSPLVRVRRPSLWSSYACVCERLRPFQLVLFVGIVWACWKYWGE